MNSSKSAPNSLSSLTQIAIVHSAKHRVFSPKIYAIRQQETEIATGSKTTGKLLKSIAGKYSPYKIFCMDKDRKNTATKKVEAFLPDKYKGHPEIIKLLCLIATSEKIVFSNYKNWVCIPSITLKNSFKTLYKPSLNKINPGSKKSVIREMIEEGLLVTDERASKDGKKALWYRVSATIFPEEAEETIILLILKNMGVLFKQGFDIPTHEESMIQYIDRNEVLPAGDRYIIKDKGRVKLTGLAENIIQRGIIGRNYISRELLIKLMDEMTRRVNRRRALRRIREVEEEMARLTGRNSQQEPPHIGDTLNGGAIAGNSPLQPSKCVSYDMAPLQISKLLSIFSSTHSVCEDMQILLHRSPQVISYTGRFFESGGSGTTGLKKSTKANNYSLIEKITGLKVYNYDLRSSQVSGLLHISKLHGFNFPQLEKYVNDKSIREKNAKATGISASIYKVLVLIKVFGGLNSYNEHHATSFQTLLADGGFSPNDAAAIIDKFNTVSSYLLADIDRWFNIVVPLAMKSCVHGSMWYRNGITIVEKNYFKNNKMKSAFLLQGLEANYILSLMSLSTVPEYQFRPLSYEYDGVISLGEIPPETIFAAAKIAEYPSAILEIKPIN